MQPETRHSTMQLAGLRALDGAARDGTASDAIAAHGGHGRPSAGWAPDVLQIAGGAATASAGQDEPQQVPTPDELLGALSAHVKAQRLRVLELELALADAEARILSQAQLLCGTGAGGEGGLFSRRPVREIVEEVLLAYPGIGWADVIGVRRERRLVEPRHRCMAAVYDEREDLSLPALGRIFRRDHTSVLHAVNKGRAKRCAGT
ncbi:helix-turn-helix domain-containing protein [Ensifer sp. LC163]|uniref:helix-turn-helix domain-containing protein n=1 Tax=Ensifer sp. LC163 TaxID=1120652 RepID=UPI00081318C2|nr:helix-turn-helix domain-containing protein [Ensifer sp. LC163]OCP38648.1 hypothetical protein BC360_00840 [Ensifer sp. LC163]